jgi:hypothetical protein
MLLWRAAHPNDGAAERQATPEGKQLASNGAGAGEKPPVAAEEFASHSPCAARG